MAQSDIAPLLGSNSGSDLVGKLLDAEDGWLSLHSGNSRPDYVRPGMIWLDTSGTPWLVKQYDGSQDIALWAIDTTRHRLALRAPQASISAASTTNVLGNASDDVLVTGNASIGSFGNTPRQRKWVKFSGTCLITYGTPISGPGGSSLTTAPGDTCLLWSDDDGNTTILFYQRAAPLVGANVVPAPGGRLTLMSGVAVTTSDIVGVGTLYYKSVSGAVIPIHDGTNWRSFPFTELTLNLDDNSGHAGYHQAGKVHDVFAFESSGAAALGTGPAWAALGTPSEMPTLLNGVWTNTSSVTLRFGTGSGNTVAVAAGKATYLGTILIGPADGLLSDTTQDRNVYNAYNQAPRKLYRVEAGDGWAYLDGVFRQANANVNNRAAVILGLGGSPADATVAAGVINSGPTLRSVRAGIGIGSSTVDGADPGFNLGAGVTSATPSVATARYVGGLGRGYFELRMLEQGAGADVQIWLTSALLGTIFM